MKQFGFSNLFWGIILCQSMATACDHHDHSGHAHNPPRPVPKDHRELSGLDSIPFADCGAKAPTKNERMAAGLIMEDFRKQRATEKQHYQIQVRFHVVRDDDGNHDMSDAMLDQYMEVLNDKYKESSFSFVKKSTDRIDSTEWHYIDDTNYWDLAYAHRQGGKSDLNIYFADIQISAGGWAYLPHDGTAGSYWDGIVLESNYVKYGLDSSFVRESVLPHEAGHWLGLYHTFEDECDSTFTTKNGWPRGYELFNGDGVADTPAHLASSRNCYNSANTCPDDVEGVDPGLDPLDNLMSYAYDSCVSKFTNGQRERMYAMFEYFRLDEETVIVTPNAGEEKEPTEAPTESPTDPPTTCGEEYRCRDTRKGVPRYWVNIYRRRRGCRTRCVTDKRATLLFGRSKRWQCGRCGA